MTYLELESIVNKPYVNIQDTMALAQVGYNAARRIVNEIKAEMELEGVPNFHKRLALVPTRRVLDKLHISAEYVREQANGMKKGGTND